MFDFLKKKTAPLESIDVDDSTIVAVTDGKIVPIESVSDDVFAQQMLGESIAFQAGKDSAVICAPANGELSVLFPTGHAFGITMKNGVELLVHIGVNTVSENGNGFKLGSFKQGDTVKAGDPIVTVDVKKLKNKYDMSTMLIVTNKNGREIAFTDVKTVTRGQSVAVVK